MGHWPKVKAKEWMILYQEMFGEELKKKTEAHRKVKRAIENAKAKWNHNFPNGLKEFKEAQEAMRQHPYFGDASKETLLELHVVLKKNFNKL